MALHLSKCFHAFKWAAKNSSVVQRTQESEEPLFCAPSFSLFEKMNSFLGNSKMLQIWLEKRFAYILAEGHALLA